MLYIISNQFDPYFNLATEEYLLTNFLEDDIIYFYRNSPSIIIGKNQNPLSEINYEYVIKNHIPVVRRLSGGGAVFHDLGNLNFCFISRKSNAKQIEFHEFTRPIIAALKKLGIDALFTGRNDLTIDGKKFSGNAQYYYKNSILHHGTLLFTSNINDLSLALKVKSSKIEGKGIKSYKSRVTNISSHLKEPMMIEVFTRFIYNEITSTMDGNIYRFNQDDINTINQLVDAKYRTWEYVYGKTSKYKFNNVVKYSGGNVEIHGNFEKGKIVSIKFEGDFFGICDVNQIEQALIGIEHKDEAILEAIKPFKLSNYFMNIDSNTFLRFFR